MIFFKYLFSDSNSVILTKYDFYFWMCCLGISICRDCVLWCKYEERERLKGLRIWGNPNLILSIPWSKYLSFFLHIFGTSYTIFLWYIEAKFFQIKSHIIGYSRHLSCIYNGDFLIFKKDFWIVEDNIWKLRCFCIWANIFRRSPIWK